MAGKRDRPHIILPGDRFRLAEPYTGYGSGSKRPPEPPAGRPAHGGMLRSAVVEASEAARQRRTSVPIAVQGATPGLYLEFDSFPGLELALGSLEKRRARDPRRHIEVVAATRSDGNGGEGEQLEQRAAVFVPDGELRHFLGQLEKYSRTAPKAPNERRHENVYDRVAGIRLAALRALFTDAPEAYPARETDPIWWEVWLRRTDGEELQRLLDFAAQAEIRVADRRIQFDDRIVTLLRASAEALSLSLDVMGDIAELQRAKETAAFFTAETTRDQAAWTLDLAERTTHAGKDAPAVCILDTGVNSGHPLLEGAFSAGDRHTCDPTWGAHDHHGHGTEMAGLALYGDLVPLLDARAPLSLRHRLESVKILPPAGHNHPDLYAAITAEATSRPEVRAPTRRRVFSLAVTSEDERDRGQPTSWSAAVDALAAGRSFDPTDKGLKYLDEPEDAHRRLLVVSAGNVYGSRLERDHLTRSDVEPVHDPAQAWNALTVGAFTDKVMISDPEWKGWSPVAPRGELSPWSTSSVAFQPRWPLKPEVVLEGGNVVHNDDGDIDWPCDDLCLLTTHFRPAEKPFVTSYATSAATAQAAGLCAEISAEYADLWPETVRALVIHSADWTDEMRRHFSVATRKGDRENLVRRYGFGVPSLERALRSAKNAVTLVAQDVIHPFSDGKMREIHVHDLPWPREALEALGETTVRLRVTLSYFIEPNPGRRGWQDRHRYASHGLRFEVKGPVESLPDFRKRLNKRALEKEEDRPASGADNDGWYLGPRARDRGSVHSDVLEASAADILERGAIAVYPVTGWWKELKARDRSDQGARYALVVSIETDEVDADVWTPVATEVGIAVPVET